MDDIVTRARAQNIEIKRQNSQQCLVPALNTRVISDRLKQNMKIIQMINKNRFSRSRERRKQELELSGSMSSQKKKNKEVILNQIVGKLNQFMKQSVHSLNLSCHSNSLNKQNEEEEDFIINRSKSYEQQLNQPKINKNVVNIAPLQESKQQFKPNLTYMIQEKNNFRPFGFKNRLIPPQRELQNKFSINKQIIKPNEKKYVYRKYLKPQLRKGVRKYHQIKQLKGKVSYICPVYLKPYKSFQIQLGIYQRL